MTANRFSVLGVEISVLNLRQAVREVLRFLGTGQKGYVCVTGVHGIVEAQDDPALRRIFNRSFLTTPDGMPLVWLGKLVQGFETMGRVYGPELMLEVFRATEGRGVRHFFYGGKPGVAEELRDAMLRQFPRSEIVGTYCPPFRALTDAEEADFISQVEAARPDVIWVGISTPKQDRFMAEYLDRLPVKLMFGVGAAFDFHTGRVAQAPRWVQQSGLEWLFRLVQEPRRLWKRYATTNPRFVWLLLKQWLSAPKLEAPLRAE